MFDPFSAWYRLMAVGASMTGTGVRGLETLTAAQQVINARTPMIAAAARAPLTGDHAELGRLVPEKMEAFSQAGSAAVAGWWAGHSVWMNHMQHLGVMAMRGRPPTAAELVDLGSRTASLTLASIEAGARLGSSTLTPVHRKATANARRLNRKTVRRAG